jgi:hypothetical protein
MHRSAANGHGPTGGNSGPGPAPVIADGRPADSICNWWHLA